MGERDLPDAVDLGRQLVGALRDLAEPRDAPRLPELGLVVVGLVLEEQGHDPLRDQVAPVDPREALRDHNAHAELSRGASAACSRLEPCP